MSGIITSFQKSYKWNTIRAGEDVARDHTQAAPKDSTWAHSNNSQRISA